MTEIGTEEMLKPDLTLSAAPDLTPEDARTAAYIDTELGWVDHLRSLGTPRTADAVLDRLFDYVLGRS